MVFATDRASALAQFRTEVPPVVTLDLGLPPDADGSTEGFAVLEEILTLSPETKVIIVTGQDTREHAMKAVAQGAYDFYTKPIDPNVLGLILRRAFYLSELEDENRRLIQSRRHMPLNGVITGCPELLKICRLIEKVAPADVGVLILGESGTGKELFARALHELVGAQGQAVLRHQLRGDSGEPDRERVVRPREGGLHRRDQAIKGKIELARPGHAVPGRGRRHSARGPGQAAASPAGTRRRAGRRRGR